MLYSKYSDYFSGKLIEEQGYLYKTWIFRTTNYDYAYKFEKLLNSIFIPGYDILEFYEPNESFDYLSGCFVYDIVFECNVKIRKRIEYIFRRMINQDFVNSCNLLLGRTDDIYSIEEIQILEEDK